MKKIAIVGGVAGGASAAARLRRLDESAEIILFERGEFISFANCGLPYYIGGAIIDKEALTLQTPESFHRRFHIDVRIKSEVCAIDRAKKTISVYNADTGGRYTESYDYLILSPGAEPVNPFSGDGIFTLKNIPDMDKIKEYIGTKRPQTALIIGGGYIGLEMAENLMKQGLDVTICEQAEHLLAPLDLDMAADVQNYLRAKGITVITGKTVDEDFISEFDMTVVAVGVRPETGLAKDAGLMLNNRGQILVDSHMKTSDAFIYAVGDAAEARHFITDEPAFIPLAGPANRQGRIAADNICGVLSEYTGTQGSSILKFADLAVAVTGLNESAALAAGVDYDKIYLYSASHATYYPGGANLFIKAIWDKASLKLLGAQVIGPDGADKRADILATAIRFGAKITDLTELELCYAPPYGSAKDPVNMVGFLAENVISGKVKQFFWQDVEALPRDGSVTLLDVRTKTEITRGMIDGFINIPLDVLRENLGKIPHGKPVYVHCHSGLRSYIACRILEGNGYDCYNLAGGWRLYESVVRKNKVKEYICTECK